jgi:hypothetical protein
LSRSQTKIQKGDPSGRERATTAARKTRKVATKRPNPKGDVDKLVLGTTNAPYRNAVSAAELAKRLASGRGGPWKVHVATFFTDVRPELILRFAELHGISPRTLASRYRAIKASTGEANPALETAFEQLAPSA